MRNLLLGPILRLVPIGLVLLGFQDEVCAAHPIAGVRVQLLLAMSAAIGAMCSAEHGAVAGFILGLLSDLTGGQPLGQSALAFGTAGLIAGYVRMLTVVPRWWMIGLFIGLASAAGEALIPVIMLLTGRDGWLNADLFRVVPIVAIASVVLAPVLCPVGRWTMRVRKPQWKVPSVDAAA